jgi:hypothetical protein
VTFAGGIAVWIVISSAYEALLFFIFFLLLLKYLFCLAELRLLMLKFDISQNCDRAAGEGYQDGVEDDHHGHSWFWLCVIFVQEILEVPIYSWCRHETEETVAQLGYRIGGSTLVLQHRIEHDACQWWQDEATHEKHQV